MKSAVTLLIGLIVVAIVDAHPVALRRTQSYPVALRQGPVRADARAVADAGGPFNALGATLFWAAWGYKFDRPRLERNLDTLRAAGFDYIRVLGSVGGATWEDRQTDPRWPDYDAIIAGVTDLAYDRYGMRVQWTLIGGAPFTETVSSRQDLVDRFAVMAKGREHKLFAFEIANEAWQNGFAGAGGIDDLRTLGQRLNAKTDVLVALSAPATNAACATYAGAAADAMTIHIPRSFGNEGPFRPLRRLWNFPASYDRQCQGQLPMLAFNNEPIGPESSVQADDSPSRIAAAYVMTFISGYASYVFHSGPGIRGGGAADRARKPPRHANVGELPSFKPIAALLTDLKRVLPPGMASWTRHAPNSPKAPLYGLDSLYVTTSGTEFVALAVNIKDRAVVAARVPMSVDVRRISATTDVKHVSVKPGESIALDAADAVLLIGRTK